MIARCNSIHKKLPKFRTQRNSAMFMREFKDILENDYNYKHWIGTILYDWDHEEYKDFYTKDNLHINRTLESSQTTINDIEKAFESGLINEKNPLICLIN